LLPSFFLVDPFAGGDLTRGRKKISFLEDFDFVFSPRPPAAISFFHNSRHLVELRQNRKRKNKQTKTIAFTHPPIFS